MNGGYYDPENMIWLPNSDNSISNYGFFPGMPTFLNNHNPRRIINRMWDKSCEVAENVVRKLIPSIKIVGSGTIFVNEFSISFDPFSGYIEICWGLTTAVIGVGVGPEIYWEDGGVAGISCGVTRYTSVHGKVGPGGLSIGGGVGADLAIPGVNPHVDLFCFEFCDSEC